MPILVFLSYVEKILGAQGEVNKNNDILNVDHSICNDNLTSATSGTLCRKVKPDVVTYYPTTQNSNDYRLSKAW
jgi:hypothetical protein